MIKEIAEFLDNNWGYIVAFGIVIFIIGFILGASNTVEIFPGISIWVTGLLIAMASFGWGMYPIIKKAYK